MQDQYDIQVRCAYCGKPNKVWYAPTLGKDTFICYKCRKYSFITEDFEAKKIEDVVYKDVVAGYVFCSNRPVSMNRLRKICISRFDLIMKKVKNGTIKK